MAHPNEELARSKMEAALREDFDGMRSHHTKDVILHDPGCNALSGTDHGKEGLQEWVRKLDELLGPGGSLTRTLNDVLATMITPSNSSR
jgi:hypothetical protein